MIARDHYILPLQCLICGRTGTAYWSERERPSVYTGIGRTLDKVSEGFKIVPPQVAKATVKLTSLSAVSKRGKSAARA